MPNKLDLQGHRFGRLLVMSPAKNLGRDVAWMCVCDCGETLRIRAHALRSGNTQSCGCIHRDQLIARNRTSFPRAPRVHGFYKTRTYSIWMGMRKRCNNPRAHAFNHYGGRGVRVCERWDSFDNFLADMGEAPEGLSIDRIDTNGNYEPSNCRWATNFTQSRNRRNNRKITYRGKTQCLTDWADECDINIVTLHTRLASGWTVQESLEGKG